MTQPHSGGAPRMGAALPPGEPLPFAVSQVVTMHLPVEITDVRGDGTLRVRVLRPWGGYRYWDCTETELFAVTKP